jgi:hypothetical protein
LGTAATLYVIPLAFEQTDVGPGGAAGAAGIVMDEIAWQVRVLLPQLLLAFAQMFPPANPEKFTVIELVVDDPDAPMGNVHVNDVALGSEGILYTIPVVLLQTVVEPVIEEGAEGMYTGKIAMHVGDPFPQPLDA